VEPKQLRNIVGDNVRKIRTQQGLNQDDLAARCLLVGFDASRSTVSHIEIGYRGVSDLEMVLLAKALRVDLGDLVPDVLPKWTKDLRPPRAVADESDSEH